MKKLIITDPAWICGSDLVSGTLDEKRECMEYDTLTFSCTTTYSFVCAHFPYLYKPYVP
jgi:hypothetical protein